MHTVSEPAKNKEKLLARLQEARPKDVERAIGVFEAKWHIVARLRKLWYKKNNERHYEVLYYTKKYDG